MGTADQVLKEALAQPLTPIEWIEPTEAPAPVSEPQHEGVVTH